MKIKTIKARQIIDSRGLPTLEAEVHCENGWGRAAIPSGASTGMHEAHELRDGGEGFAGKAVTKAVANIEGEIANAIVGMQADDQFKIDNTMLELDGTENKERLGANAILGVSLAVAHAASGIRNIPLYKQINDIAGNPKMSIPMPMFNVLNGGQHARQASDFQEYMLIAKNAKSYTEAVFVVAEIYSSLKKLLKEKNLSTNLGDEGGFAPSVSSNTETLDLLVTAVEATRFKLGTDIVFGLDVAAAEFLKDGNYELKAEGRSLSADELIDYYVEITKKYPIVSLEDGLGEDEWADWQKLTTKLPDLQLVGDDILVTNPTRLQKAIEEKAGNSILIKPNQIGTLTETLHTIKKAHDSGWSTVISHRSGETEDVTIAHLAVGANLGQIKTGSTARGERTAKHNELIRIEDMNMELKIHHPFQVFDSSI